MKPALLDGFFKQLQVVQALILRETRTRFGNHYLGYLWAFLEPIFWISMFAGLYYIARRTAPPGLDVIAFLATGVVPYLTFRQTTDRSIKSISSNTALLFYPQVRPLDLVLARSVLEVTTLTTVFVVLVGVNALVQQTLVINNLLYVALGFLLAGLLGMTAGLTLCALSTFSNVILRISSPLLRPLFWTSGLFFSVGDLPSWIRDLLLWNPVLHVVEIVREGYFIGYGAQYGDPKYVTYWVLGLALFGLTAERMSRRRLEVI
jgi:capsular polysaccharide transport system permease protein